MDWFCREGASVTESHRKHSVYVLHRKVVRTVSSEYHQLEYKFLIAKIRRRTLVVREVDGRPGGDSARYVMP